MKESSPNKRGSRRAVVILIGLGAIAVTGAFLSKIPDELRARRHDRRVREHIDASSRNEARRVMEAHLYGLAHLQTAKARGYLEAYSLVTGDEWSPSTWKSNLRWRQMKSLRLLEAFYPESWISKGIAEYTKVRGNPFFWFHFPDASITPEQARGLRAWLDKYPHHPSADDACLLVALHAMRNARPQDALRWFGRGLDFPDGDVRHRYVEHLRTLLGRSCSPEVLDTYLAESCPEMLRGMVLYHSGLWHLRQKHFARAAEQLCEFREKGHLAGALPNADALPDSGAPARLAVALEPALVRKHVEEQIELARRLADLQHERRDANSPEEAARALHAMARACFRAPRRFRNVFQRKEACLFPWSEEPSPKPLPCTGYRHAIDLLRELLRACPDYSKRELVDYSIPLCLWKARQATRGLSWQILRRVDRAISEGFQSFADTYPESSMADEALYQAGICHYESTDRKETSRMVEAMRRIVREYPRGNVIVDCADNPYLAEAIAQRDTGHLRTGR